MTNIQETSDWQDELLLLETTTPAKGGVTGQANAQARVLGGRTRWLRDRHLLVSSEVNKARRTWQDLDARFAAIEDRLAYFLQGPMVAPSVTPGPGYIQFEATVEDNTGTTRVEFYVDGVRIAEFAARPFQKVVQGTAFTNGSHSFVVRAKDDHGNWTTTTPLAFSVANPSGGGGTTPVVPDPDTQPPAISLVQVDGRTGTIALVARVKDNQGVRQVDFHVDGALAGIEWYGTPVDATSGVREYRFRTDSRLLANGAHQLLVRAYDYAGNLAVYPEVSFQVDNPPDTEAPMVTSIQALASGGSVGFLATATDNVRVKFVEYWVDGTKVATSTTASTWPATAHGLSAGPHSAVAKAFDYAGNSSTSAPVAFTI